MVWSVLSLLTNNKMSNVKDTRSFYLLLQRQALCNALKEAINEGRYDRDEFIYLIHLFTENKSLNRPSFNLEFEDSQRVH